jgi:hypothetical protein
VYRDLLEPSELIDGVASRFVITVAMFDERDDLQCLGRDELQTPNNGAEVMRNFSGRARSLEEAFVIGEEIIEPLRGPRGIGTELSDDRSVVGSHAMRRPPRDAG